MAEAMHDLIANLRFLFVSGHVHLDVSAARVPAKAVSVLGTPLTVGRLIDAVAALHQPD